MRLVAGSRACPLPSLSVPSVRTNIRGTLPRMSHPAETHSGSCLCGEVRYEVDEFLRDAAHCHCSMCRKFHGAAFATLASAPNSGFRWLSGSDLLQDYRAKNGTVRTFCRQCGSSLTFTTPKAPNYVEVALATLDDDCPVTPNANIFVKFGVSWAPIAPGSPCYAEARNSPALDPFKS